jgi:hypothetical protein
MRNLLQRQEEIDRVDRERTAATRQRQTDVRAREERMRSGMYGDARQHQLAATVRARCATAGIRNEPDILAAIENNAARFEPLLTENPDLSVRAFTNIVESASLPASGADLQARNEMIVGMARTKVYGTRATIMDVVTQENAAVKATPILNSVLKAGAGSNPAVALERLRTRLDSTAKGR